MNNHSMEDSVIREIRRSALARRLILHRARTQTIGRLTGLSRNRLAALRRRLMVGDEERLRGPLPSSLDVFLHSNQAQTEAAALAALFAVYDDHTSNSGTVVVRAPSGLDCGEELCEIYEAYLAYHPHTEIQLEEMMLLRRNLAKGDTVSLGRCRRCEGLILIDRLGHSYLTCWHCRLASEATGKCGDTSSRASPPVPATILEPQSDHGLRKELDQGLVNREQCDE